MKDYSENGTEIDYECLQIKFKGKIEFFDSEIQKYRIKIYEWGGRGYPHFYYHLTKKEIEERTK